jgi:hypothetical protein
MYEMPVRKRMQPLDVHPGEREFFSEKLGYNPWAEAQKIHEQRAARQMLDELLEARLIEPKQAKEVEKQLSSGGAKDAIDALSQDPKGFKKFFPKR